jgi:serine/threonine protein kinase/ABC-type phosphate/phosphonate transport system substrate-binding protein
LTANHFYQNTSGVFPFTQDIENRALRGGGHRGMRLSFGIFYRQWLLCLLLFVAAVVKGQDSEGHCEGSIEWVNGTHKEVYDVGVLAIRGFGAAYAEFNATFSDYLTATAGARFNPPVQFRLKPLNFLLLFSDTASAEVDFFYVNPSAFSCIESEFGASSLVSQISKRKVDDQVYQLTKFGGVIFTLANATIDSVYDLRNRSIAAASISGLGSGQMQFRVLQQAGLSYINDPSQVVFTSNQGKVVNGVLNGEFEVGFVRTDQLERSNDANGEPIDRTQIKIIDPIEGLQIGGVPFPFASSTPLYAEWNLAALPHVSNDVNLAVQDAMLGLQAHANVGDRLVECYSAQNCTGESVLSQEACEQACNTDFLSTSIRCDTTPELALLASSARNNGKYTGWRSTLSYMELRNMQEETGFINKNPETGKMQCIRSANIYDAIVCPPGHFKKSEEEVAMGCFDAGLECKIGFQCVCKPCVKAFDVDIFSVQSTTTSFLADVEERQSGCPKFSICGSTEQTKTIQFVAVDNKERDDLSLVVRLHDEFDYREIKAQRVEGSNYTYDFALASKQVGVLVFEVFADGEQVPESPLRVSVQARNCANDYGDGLRFPDENGICVCSSNSIQMGGRCVSYAILIPAILVPFFLVGAAAIFLYVEKKKNQADSVWAVKVSELVFDDPPTIIGRGTFGLVLLAEYRGTQVAVKRVIPPKFELKNQKKGEDSVHRASMLGGGDYDDASGYEDAVSGMESGVSHISEKILKRESNQSSRSDFSQGNSYNSNAAIESASQSFSPEGEPPQDNPGPSQQEDDGSPPQRRRHSIGSQNSDHKTKRLSWAGGARRASFDLDAYDVDDVKSPTPGRRASFLPPPISSGPSNGGVCGNSVSGASVRPIRPERRRSALDIAFDFDQDTSERRRSSQVDFQEGSEDENEDESPIDKEEVDIEAGAQRPESVVRNHGMSSMTTSLKGTNSVRFSDRGLKSGWGSAGMLSRQSSDFSMNSLPDRQPQGKYRSAGLRSFNRNLKKILLFGQNDEYKKLKADFITEMRHLSKLRHPCITTVMGAVISNFDEPMLVMEYMDHGSLYDILHNETMVVDGELLLPILRDIAQGVRFLHTAEPQVIHGDLKAQNVLVDGKFRAKVADFGLSQKKKVGATGTPYWMAPELLRGESQNNASSDVYSFGIILYEVYSRKVKESLHYFVFIVAGVNGAKLIYLFFHIHRILMMAKTTGKSFDR